MASAKALARAPRAGADAASGGPAASAGLLAWPWASRLAERWVAEKEPATHAASGASRPRSMTATDEHPGGSPSARQGTDVPTHPTEPQTAACHPARPA